MVVPWLIDPFFEGTPVADAGKRYKKKVDDNKKKIADRNEAQRKKNRKRISEGVSEFGDFLLDNSDLPISVLSPVVRPVVIGFQAAEMVAEFAAEKTIEAGGVGAIDLFTPEIRRYEDTALVGMGGMRI